MASIPDGTSLWLESEDSWLLLVDEAPPPKLDDLLNPCWVGGGHPPSSGNACGVVVEVCCNEYHWSNFFQNSNHNASNNDAIIETSRIEVHCYCTCCLAACASMKSCPFSRLSDRGGGCCIACSCSEVLACLVLLTSDGLFCISGARRTPAELMGLKGKTIFFDAVKVLTTLQSMINAKLSKQRFWHCHENGLIKTNQTIPHNLLVCVKSSSLYWGLG